MRSVWIVRDLIQRWACQCAYEVIREVRRGLLGVQFPRVRAEVRLVLRQHNAC